MKIAVAYLSEANQNERMDSHFFRPEFIDSYKIINKCPHNILSEIAHITDGNHLKIAENFDNVNGVRYMRGQDLSKDMILHDRNIIYIPESTYSGLRRSHIFRNDILITIVGANTGLVGLVYDPPEKLVANCKLGIARANLRKINPAYLYSFLVGKYGQNQILRTIRGGGQTGLILPDMRGLKIVRFSKEFEEIIADVIYSGHSMIKDAKQVFILAQELILADIGLKSWQPKHQLTFIKNYSDTQQAERIDAEYFQPKYDEIVKAIKKYSGGWNILNNLVKLKERNFNPKDEIEYKYIELSSITGNGEISDCMVQEGKNLPSRARRKVSTGDIIVSSIEGSLSSIALIQKEYNQALCSTGFHVINSKSLNPETLLVLMKSIVGQLQLKKGCKGTILTAISRDEFGKIILPVMNDKVQIEIQQKVAKSLDLRKKSKYLLESAKRAVEIAIEKDEETAIKWLKEKAIKRT